MPEINNLSPLEIRQPNGLRIPQMNKFAMPVRERFHALAERQLLSVRFSLKPDRIIGHQLNNLRCDDYTTPIAGAYAKVSATSATGCVKLPNLHSARSGRFAKHGPRFRTDRIITGVRKAVKSLGRLTLAGPQAARSDSSTAGSGYSSGLNSFAVPLP